MQIKLYVFVLLLSVFCNFCNFPYSGTPIAAYSLTLATDAPETTHEGCCHEFGNVFILLNKPLMRYLQEMYAGSGNAQKLISTIRSLELIIQDEHGIYSRSLKNISRAHKFFIKGKKRVLKKLIEGAIIDNTIIDPGFLTNEPIILAHLKKQKKSGKRIVLDEKQERKLCLRLLALAEKTDKELKASIL